MVLVSGIAVVDLIASGLGRVARPGELVFGSVSTTLGGHACNVSVDLVRLGFPRTQIRVVFPAGRDLFGDFLARRLREQGLRADPVRTAGAPTSLDLILVARGEDRRYHADPGANVAMEAGPVLALLEKHRPLVYYAGGVGLLGRFDTDLAAVLRRARKLGATTFVDVVSPYKKTWAFLRRALPFTDVFHCNADEAASLVGRRDPSKAAAALRRLGASSVFVTLGGEGVVAAVPGAFPAAPGLPRPRRRSDGRGRRFLGRAHRRGSTASWPAAAASPSSRPASGSTSWSAPRPAERSALRGSVRRPRSTAARSRRSSGRMARLSATTGSLTNGSIGLHASSATTGSLTNGSIGLHASSATTGTLAIRVDRGPARRRRRLGH
ncbi:MAG: carbohydrate kinase family protein [Candidatus Moduliflexus flocculans]|nr:carbohydrate kinase family protein [Candidatus Moduliflexus flocculans]